MAKAQLAEAAVAHHTIIIRSPSPGTEEILFTIKAPQRFAEVIVPKGMHVTTVESPQGSVNFQVRHADDRSTVFLSPPQSRVTITGSRQSEVVVPGQLFTSEVFLGGFSQGRDVIQMFAEVPEVAMIFAASEGAEFDRTMRRVAVSAKGAASLWFTYETGTGGNGVVDSGAFRMITEPALAEGARVVGQLASTKLAGVAAQAGVQLPWPGPIRVVTYEPPRTSLEDGYYGGRGILYLNRIFLAPSSDAYPLRGGAVLLHESFHVLSTPYGTPPAAAWFAEGAAVQAQRHLEPRNGYEVCRAGGCTLYGYGLSFQELEEMYVKPAEKILSWNLEDGPLLYAYAGFVVEAYIDDYGNDTYQRVWRSWSENQRDPGCTCDSNWLLQEMAKHAGAASAAEILFPKKDTYNRDRSDFRRDMAHLLAEPAQRLSYDATPWLELAASETGVVNSGLFAAPSQREISLPALDPAPTLPSPLILVVGLTGAGLTAMIAVLFARRRRGPRRANSVRIVTPTITDQFDAFHVLEEVCPGTDSGTHDLEDRVVTKAGKAKIYRMCRVCRGAVPCD